MVQRFCISTSCNTGREQRRRHPTARARGGRCPPPLPTGTGAAGPPEAPSAPPAAPHGPWTDRGHHHAPASSPPGRWCPAESFLLIAAPCPGKSCPTPAPAHLSPPLRPTVTPCFSQHPGQAFEGHQGGPDGHRVHAWGAWGGFRQASSDLEADGQRAQPALTSQRTATARAALAILVRPRGHRVPCAMSGAVTVPCPCANLLR